MMKLTSKKFIIPLLLLAGAIVLFVLIKTIPNQESDNGMAPTAGTDGNAQAAETGVSFGNDRVLVITMTRCPECREGLKPYLEKIKNDLGAEIKEYQVASPWDPATNQILSENGLARPSGGGMPLVCINDKCLFRMGPITAELNKFLEQKI